MSKLDDVVLIRLIYRTLHCIYYYFMLLYMTIFLNDSEKCLSLFNVNDTSFFSIFQYSRNVPVLRLEYLQFYVYNII